MRASISLAIFAAIGAQAIPQSVQPITQIADGQIQAPPATAPIESFSVHPITQISDGQIQAPPAPTNYPVGPPSMPSPPPYYTSGTPVVPVVPTTAPTMPAYSTGVPGSIFPTGTLPSVTLSTPSLSSLFPTAPAQETNAATSANMVPFGGLALAVLAFFA